MKEIVMILVTVSMVSFVVCYSHASATSSIKIAPKSQHTPISPYSYGQFIEHLGRCIYGGIWAEMLEDRKFFYPVDGKRSGWEMHAGENTSWQGHGIPYEVLIASPWQILGPTESVWMNHSNPFTGEHDPVIRVEDALAKVGIYHPRLALEKGRSYVGYAILKAQGDIQAVEIALQWGEEPSAETVVTLKNINPEFTKYAFSFSAGDNTLDGRLMIRCQGKGELHIGAVSLMPEDHVEGFRRDTLELLRTLNAPIYRWPGGNFVSGYDWRDGVGDRDKRPPRKNPAWTGIEHNDVGLHEYLRLCELINTEPFIALNTGLGDVASAAAEVEYVVGAPDTPEGARRAANGRTEPWKVTYWAVGNEMYGDWQLGHMPLEDYVKKHNAVVEAIRAVSPEAHCVAVGAVGVWSETMLKECKDHMELISEHLYWQRRDNVAEHVRVAVDAVEHVAKSHRRYRETIPGLKEKDIRIALDEWNYWYGPYLYGELGVRYFMRDALGCAAVLHAMFRNSDLYFMANYAQTVNVIGAIKTTQTRAWMETTGLVLTLYRREFGSFPVDVETGDDTIYAAAAWTKDGSALTLSLVNVSDTEREVALELKDTVLPQTIAGWRISHSDPEAYNDENNPNTVAIQDIVVRMENGKMVVPGYSITLLRIPALMESGRVRWDLEEGRWGIARAHAWQEKHGWCIGANFLPSTASNQFEMWQAETWDPETIDRELGWAAGLGFNTMRVYLHDMLWKADPAGLEKRMDEYLAIADKHGIKTIFVPFDCVWDPYPEAGPQKEPVPHVHNSRWAQSPHVDVQKDIARYEQNLKPYIWGILTRFKDDPRILAWDLMNEPGNVVPQYEDHWDLKDREEAHLILLDKLFTWAREINPSQPLTAGVWIEVGRRIHPVHSLDKLMLERSDIITFHSYEPLPFVQQAVEWLKNSGRPILCTEYMSRGSGSTFESILPYFKKEGVGAINWGLVSGRSQTIYPWDSWDKPYTAEPNPWFHDVFRKDGTPYKEEETKLIRTLTGRQ